MKWKSLGVGKAPKQGFFACKVGFGGVCLLFVYV